MSKSKAILLLGLLMFALTVTLAAVGVGAYVWLNGAGAPSISTPAEPTPNAIALNPTQAPAASPTAAPPANEAAAPINPPAAGDPIVAPPIVAPPALDSADAVAAWEGRLVEIYERVNPSVVFIGTDQGQGSGFVWNDQGYIVTNNHVIAGARQVRVAFVDGAILPADIVGRDPASDLAVLRVEAPAATLAPITLGNSLNLAVGQLAIAIGNPFGQQGSMTVGIISALGRVQPAGDTSAFSTPDMIQTDAAINPGNSGGVLLDEAGDLIGVTSNIISASGTSAGIGFAIPAHLVGRVVPALIATGTYDHPYLGVTGTTLTAETAVQLGLSADTRGTLLVSVTPGGPADEAGLRGGQRSGDVVVAVDGVAVANMDDLITYLARYGVVGEAVTMTVIRDGTQQNVAVVLGARPA